jgi:DhnA family fructose-bisphosphate aldolase class Ia
MIMEAGGSGVIFGRNVWQREWNAARGIIDQIKDTLLKSRVRIP